MPFNRIVIYPYGPSNGARELARAVHATRVRQGGGYVPRPTDLLINWGNPRVPGWWNHNARTNALNQPESVRNAINKIRTFRLLEQNDVSIPPFATNLREARNLFRTTQSRVLCRTVLTGHSGRGIVIANAVGELVEAPLYTKYVPKEREYRLHVLNGEVIDIEQKRKRNDARQERDVERLVRSHRHGWIFARNNVDPIDNRIRNAAITSVRALGLNFGAVDLGVHTKHGIKVYEVNTAPGIEGTTVERYSRALRDLLG